jgi:uncharacterized surface protein with fasciclin (FAS1) repeats
LVEGKLETVPYSGANAMKPTLTRLSAAVLALALLTSACSDDSEDAASAEADTQTSVAPTDMSSNDATDEASDDATPSGDIVDTAVAAGEFTTLVAAVQAAGLEETLRGEGPFTVFAPTDAAFDALPEGTVETLLEDPTGQLADILTYHVVEGAVPAAEVVMLDGQPVTTVNGATFTVNVDGDVVTLTDAAGNEVAVTATDVEASNGIIHVIDAVLMPA